ncbi:MAG: EAL domain-containing protein [Alphaproteobacteria bacterium]|nr:EAL domain-containing protein [Alphaproteobacteria bacterium]
MAAKKTKTKKTDYSVLLLQLAWACGILICAVLVSLLSMISLELGLVAATLIAAACFILPGGVKALKGRKRQAVAEKASYEPSGVAKVLADMQDRQDRMSASLQKHTQELADLKTSLAEIEVAAKTALQKASMPPPVVPAPVERIVPTQLRARDVAAPVAAASSKQAVRPPPPAFPANDEDMDVDSAQMSDLVVRELLHAAVEARKIEAFMQPIMKLPKRQMAFYEVFARVRAKPGLYLPAERYMPIAVQEALMARIDNTLLLHSLFLIRKDRDKPGGPNGFFLNISPRILKDRHFMNDLLRFLARNRKLAPLLIFEMTQTEFFNVSVSEHKILEALGKLGCRFSLDHVAEVPGNVMELQDRNVRFIKISVSAFPDAKGSARQVADIAAKKRALEEAGIDIIAAQIETEEDLRGLLDYDLQYGQGYLFGKPGIHGRYRVQNAA